ncbi:hypothetical protein HDU84_000695 [Entophlyctis sp. JEL0112]|nr:hypothetical protein HDU84_000695 [Entophlyctis sp. JEL0112]
MHHLPAKQSACRTRASPSRILTAVVHAAIVLAVLVVLMRIDLMPKSVPPRTPTKINNSPDAYTQPAPLSFDVSHPWYRGHQRALKEITQLTRSQKKYMVLGLGERGGPCEGVIASQPHIGFKGLCLQDGPVGPRMIENITAKPAHLNLAATFDRELMEKYGIAVGKEFRRWGINVALGPMMNMVRAPTAGRNWESGGADPFLTSASASLIVRGIQSQGVIATAKHLILNEQEHYRSDSSSNIDMRTLMEIYMQPFEACVNEGVGAVMCSYNLINNTYACANDEIINNILKGPDINFRGFVMTDWFAHYSLMASDMVMAGRDNSHDTFAAIDPLTVDSLTLDDIPDSRLDDMVLRILTVYYSFRQDTDFPDHKFNAWIDRPKGVYKFKYEFEASRQLARDVGAASVIMLKNDGRLLPLPKNAGGLVVGVIGEDARRPTLLNDEGTWDGTLAQGMGSGSCEFPYLYSPLEGIQDRVKHTLEYTTNNDIEAAVSVAKAVDIAIVFANVQSGEGWDRGHLKLDKSGDELIEAVANANQKTIVVVHTVGQIEMPWVDHPNISAVLFPLMPGQETGNSLSDVIFGHVNPSGRLPFTIYKERKDYAADVVYSSPDPIPQINYNEGLYFDYRHADKYNITPQFPFGFGLSYTTFEFKELEVQKLKNGAIEATVVVKNTGDYDGHEVVQLYVSFPEAADEPPKVLKGFERVFVRKGSSKKVRILVDKKAFRVWLSGGWQYVPGDYSIILGSSSRDLKAEATLTLF